MNLLRSITSALNNLRVNKMRSILTMLGVIIGVSSVIVMVGIVEGVRAKVVSEFERMGSSLIIVLYAPTEKDLRSNTLRLDGLKMDDVRAIQTECDLVKTVSAELGGGGNDLFKYQDKESKGSSNGVMPDYLHLRNHSLAQGRFLTEEDMATWNKVCVIGDKVNRELFAGVEPLGKTIEVHGVAMSVVGVLAPKGRTGGEDQDKIVLAPITTVQKRLLGQEVVGMMWAQAYDAAMVNPAMEQIWQCLMKRHGNTPGFRVDSQENMLNSIGRILTMFGLMLGGVAGLALLVGGIGVMNIMLVTVTERTREIGLRKAVGARRKDILIQFLIESATMTGVGGILGIATGAGLAYAIGAITKKMMPGGINNDPGIPIHLPLWSILGAFAFSASVGVFFGLYPAIRASRLDPIVALRHE